MKTTLTTSSPAPAKPTKQDPFQRISLAVKKLDQLINRAHQLSTFTDQLLREDTTGPSIPHLENIKNPSTSSDSSTKLKAARKFPGN